MLIFLWHIRQKLLLCILNPAIAFQQQDFKTRMKTEEIKAGEIVETLCDRGWQAYIAGGAARDLLSGGTPEDYDVVTSATYDQIRAVFKGRKLKVVGTSFRVCIIDGIEVATYRKDTDYGSQEIKAEATESVHEDLSRRDLTINAMAFCPHTGEIVDDFGGVDDLKAGIIRFTGNPYERIDEDPCRIIRACRFLAKIDGGFAPESLKALRDNRHRIKDVAPERIRLEILKTMKYKKAGLFFDALNEVGILDQIFPGMVACITQDGGKYHDETVYEHQKIVGDALPKNRPLLRLAGYLHDIGKPVEAEHNNDNINFIDHERTGAKMVESILTDHKFSLKETAWVTSLVNLHMRSIDGGTKNKTVRKALKAFLDSGITWKDWLLLKVADRKGNLLKSDFSHNEIRSIVMRINSVLRPEAGEPAFNIRDLAVNGGDVISEVNVAQGPEVGILLNRALDYVLDDPERNTRERLMEFIIECYRERIE